MYTYANGFQLSVKNDKSEVLLRFTQAAPVLSREGAITDTQEEVVSSVIINGQLAKKLIDNLTELLSADDE